MDNNIDLVNKIENIKNDENIIRNKFFIFLMIR